MESGSDDEFFDAPENLSLNRSKSIATDSEESRKETPTKEHEETEHEDLNGNSLKNATSVVNKEQEIDIDNDLNDKERNDDIISFQEKCIPDEDDKLEVLSLEEKNLLSKETSTKNETDKRETFSNESCINEVEINHSLKSEQVEISPKSPTSITPVAPPRRKKKGAKKDVIQKELIVGENHNLLLPIVNPKMSSIQVNVNSQEMDLVIERGNSLNVVYNNDLMATKSGSSIAMDYSSNAVDVSASSDGSKVSQSSVTVEAGPSTERNDDTHVKSEPLATIENTQKAEKPPRPTRPEGPIHLEKPQRPKPPEFIEKSNKEGEPSKPSRPEIPERPAGMHSNLDAACQLTDEEILEQITIKNLDTGESIPLSMAEENIPECTNPLSLHIFKLATEHDYDTNLPNAQEADEDGHLSDVSTASGGKMQGKRKKLRKFLGKTVQKIKSVADEVSHQVRKGEEEESSGDEQEEGDNGYIKFKHHRAKKERLMFDQIKLLQDLSGEHIGAIWTMKFSLCGKLLASAGQDNIVRVWVLKDAAINFEEMRKKYSRPMGRVSPTGSMTSSNSTASADDELQLDLLNNTDDDTTEGPFRAHPFVRYHGHTSDVLDLSWSKNYFLLSSSMDKTVRLWHISRQECLCCFQHVDFVTAICFHPRDDRYFLSGSLDGKIRLWNIPEKKVALWNEIDGYGTSLVTAANFCQNGKLAVVGTYDGRCIFFDTEKLKYHTQVTVRSSRGKNARGRKISGIEPMPGEDKVLITSNDNRIRLYDLKDHSLSCKYKGSQNGSSQIRANFSHDGKFILCGSEDKFVYIWPTHHDVPNVRKDRNEYYESFSAHDAVVTAAIFAPFPTAIIEKPSQEKNVPTTLSGTLSSKEHSSKPFEIIVAADWQGGVKLYINR